MESQIKSTTALAHEENVLRDPFNPEPWHDYLNHLSKHTEDYSTLFPIFERAVAALPQNFELWYQYVQAFQNEALKRHPDHPCREASLEVSHRAALTLKSSLVLWKNFISQLIAERRFTRSRQAVNKSLQLLPLAQHFHIWKVVTKEMLEVAPARTCVRLLQRYAKIESDTGQERIFHFMVKARMWESAVRYIAVFLSDGSWKPREDTWEQLWVKLARVASKHGASINTVDIPTLIRSGISRLTTENGELWVSLAHYYTRKALFRDARKVYEEAVTSLASVRDFAIVFDSYAKFQESLTSAAIEEMEELKKDATRIREFKEAEETVESLIQHLEVLTKRRPMLLSDVCLRQNPHNVHEWHKRARMYKREKDAINVVNTYTKAIQTVDPWQSTNGRSHTLWLAFARYYEDSKDPKSARGVLEKAVENPEVFRKAEDLAAVWCEYAEMELRCIEPTKSVEVLRRAVEVPSKIKREEMSRKKGISRSNVEPALRAGAGNVTISHEYDQSSQAWKAYKSRRLWHFLIDLTHSLSPEKDVVKLHHRMLELQLASPQTILSGCAYLESKRLFEQAFRLYDMGCSAIPWPEVLQIWVVYLTKFVSRYRSQKLERTRDLFEEAIRTAPTTKKAGHIFPHPQLRLLYLMYADMEEKYSLARHMLKVLARACRAVLEEDRPDMYRLYIVKMATTFGVTKTRPIYEEALSTLRKTIEVIEFASRYATMESRIGEFDRARAIYVQTCHVVDTRARGVYEMFWKGWNEFELTHGSEDTYTDMLRHKRDVELNSRGVPEDMDVLMDNQEGIRNMVIESKSQPEHSAVKDQEQSEQADEEKVDTKPNGAATKDSNDEEIEINVESLE